MTDELEGEHIIKFTSGGPKNYGYITNTWKKCCKVCGFTLNVPGSQQLNYDVMHDNLIDPQDERRDVPVSGQIFKHDPNTKDIHIGQLVKRYGLVFDKRVVDCATFKSHHYGYTPMLDDTDMVNVDTLIEL